MKNILLVLGLLLTSLIGQAQTFTPDIVKGRVTVKSLKYTSDSLKVGFTTNVTLPMSLRTPALQLTFTKVEKIDGKWMMTTPVYVGYSYIFSAANGVVHQDSSITVENRFFFGGGFNFGVTPDLTDGGRLIGSVPIGAIVGYSRYGAFAGYDVVNNKPVFGVSLNLLNVPILQSLTRFNMK